MGSGIVEIVDEPIPVCPPGGLLVKTEASGLCSGELMDWYMDRKIPHVLGHEVAGTVAESEDERFPVGSRVFPHHHAPCLKCDLCQQKLYVHCEQWKRTKLVPGGMAEYFGVPAENLNDTLDIGEMRAADAALIEPFACVLKSVTSTELELVNHPPTAVIGLGVMGLMHANAHRGCVGLDLNPARIAWAKEQGIDARSPDDLTAGELAFKVVFVCPGSQAAFDLAIRISAPGATIVLFAPLPPGDDLRVPQEAYFKDLRIVNSYSCGPNDTQFAKDLLEAKEVCAEQFVSDFITLEQLPDAYAKMKRGEILKPMVLFD
jgi:L-iditol 2-dehydrogenase